MRALAAAILVVSSVSSAFADARAAEPWFVDVAAERGIDFVHQDGRSGEKYYVESAASGGGFLDYDGDGDLDVYLINGAATPGSKLEGTPTNRLYEQRDGRFVDVGAEAGVADSGYGMGMCVGDVNADGLLDFLVTNYGADRLYVARRGDDGGVRFRDEAVARGVADERWGTGCAFADLDGDGDLDLYVAHYVDFRFDKNPYCGDRARGLRAYCRPEAFDGLTDSLFVNQGDGTFREEGAARGIIAEAADEKGFGVLASDLDDDGDIDLYVANDGTMNRLYVNDGKGRFEDQALFSGVGLSGSGLAESGMGVAAGDADGDGKSDLIVTNYSMETNTLYKHRGALVYDDVTTVGGLKEATYPFVAWGIAFVDVDRDTDLDLVTVNGHAVDNIEVFEAGLRYRQPNQLFLNDGRGRFRDGASEAGPSFTRARVSRGLAVGDFDDDGRPDLLVTNTNDPAELLVNRAPGSGHWLGIRLQGRSPNRFAIGARVTVRAGSAVLVRDVRSGGSFLSQDDLRPLFGLGAHGGSVEVDVRWPDGLSQRVTIPDTDRYVAIVRLP